MKERNQALDAVKGFAILLVMFGHCIVWNNMAPTDSYLYDLIKTVQMPLFMAVSGYLAGLGKNRRGAKELGRLLAKRAKAYLIPFFVWPILLHPMHPIQEIVGILFQLDKGLWFFMTLFVATVVSELAQYMADRVCSAEQERNLRHLFCYLGVIFVCYVLFFLQGRSQFTFLSPSLTLSYLPFYVGGECVSAYVLPGYSRRMTAPAKERSLKMSASDHSQGNIQRILWLLWAVSAILFAAMIIQLDLQKSGGIKELFIQMSSGALGVFVCFWGIYNIKKGKTCQGLAKIGTYTLQLYVVQYALHGIFVQLRNLGDTVYSLYTPKGLLTVALTFLLMCIVSGIVIFVTKRVPLLDALLFGHTARLGKSVQ